MTPQPLVVGEPAPEALGQVEVLRRGGRPVALGELWGEGPSLTVFLRHFGCVGCNMNVSDLAPRLHELELLGIRTVLVGNGSAAHLEGFIQRFKLEGKPAALVTDPALESHRVAGLRRAGWFDQGPLRAWEILRGFSQGYANRWVQGSSPQQGGTLLLDADRRVAFLHRDRSVTDFSPATEVVDAALRLRAQALTGAGS